MTEEDFRICKKCLIRDIGDAELVKTIQDAIDRLDDKTKTSADEYERRLKICNDCEDLVSGTCMKCGCYVEIRAAIKKNRCPVKNGKW